MSSPWDQRVLFKTSNSFKKKSKPQYFLFQQSLCNGSFQRFRIFKFNNQNDSSWLSVGPRSVGDFATTPSGRVWHLVAALCLRKACLWGVHVASLLESPLSICTKQLQSGVWIGFCVYSKPKPPRSARQVGPEWPLSWGTQLCLTFPSWWRWAHCSPALNTMILSSPQCCGYETAWTVFSVRLEGR